MTTYGTKGLALQLVLANVWEGNYPPPMTLQSSSLNPIFQYAELCLCVEGGEGGGGGGGGGAIGIINCTG